MFKKITLYLLIVVGLLSFSPVLAQEENSLEPAFKAEVIKIIEERAVDREDGSKALQQNILLRGLEGEWRGKEVVFNGISELDVVSANSYKIGDKVFIQRSINIDGQEVFYIHDFVREKYLYILAAIFALITIIVGRLKGFKALFSLVVSFLIIVKFILPQIIAGRDPLLFGVIGAFMMMLIIVYLTEGWNKKAHLALLSIFISLLITLGLAWLFTILTHLTGSSDEEASFLIGLTKTAINFRGLLLAGMIIGALGVLDDLIVGQIEATEQIREANPDLNNKKVFHLAYKVGNTHLGGMINTLFLVYAGAALPLLLLFTANEAGGVTYSQAINNELIATEMVRTLVGAIGVVLSMPIATFFGAYFLKTKK